MSNYTGPGQVENLETNLPPSGGEDPNKPRMPFKTNYVLTREQEDALVDHVCLRIDQIEEQLGKKSGTNGQGKGFQVTCEKDSFFGKRQKYTARYYNHVEDRAEPNTIYKHSNVTASISQRITKQMIAKANNFFFGEPDDAEWFMAEGIGVEDTMLADTIKKWARHKAEACNIKPSLCQGVEYAFVRGETVMKGTHQERFQIYKRTEEILVNEAGEPIYDAFKDYIVRNDVFIPEMKEQALPAVPAEGFNVAIEENVDPAAEAAPQMALVPTGRQVLKRDGKTLLPEKVIWKQQVVSRKLVTFEGPELGPVYYLDFGAPLDAPGIQPGEADLIYHLYDRTVMFIAQMFRGQYGEGDSSIADFRAALELLRNICSATSQPKSAVSQPRSDFKEQDTDQSPNNPLIQVAEVWLTYDADGDGVEEEIMFVVDRLNKAPIYYEYTANVTVRGLRPFNVIRPCAVDGRWWGFGAMEYFDPEQEFIDLNINRYNFRMSKAGSVTFWAPWCTIEGDRDRNLQLNDGATYTLKQGCKATDALERIQLPENAEHLMDLIQLFTQFMTVKGAVQNSMDQQIAGLPSSELATGINDLRESGDEMFATFLMWLFMGISPTLRDVIDIIFTNLNETEVFTYFNGRETEILQLSPDDVRGLALNVRLVLTRSRDRQILEAGNITDALIANFYGQPLIIQQRTADYARQRLKSLRIAQPDKIIEPTDPALLAPPLPPAPM